MANFNYNKVLLGGRLTSDIELKQSPNGESVVNGCIAVHRRNKNPDGSYTADFFQFVAWKSLAEFIARYFKKGSCIFLGGDLQNRSYVDKLGTKRYVTELIVREAHFVDGKEALASEGVPTFTGGDIPRFEDIGSDEDLPF